MEKELAKRALNTLQKKLKSLRYSDYGTLKNIEKKSASIDIDGISAGMLDSVWKRNRRKHTVLTYDDDESVVFHLKDWQGDYPSSIEEVQNYTWLIGDTGREAIIMDGLPRMF